MLRVLASKRLQRACMQVEPELRVRVAAVAGAVRVASFASAVRETRGQAWGQKR